MNTKLNAAFILASIAITLNVQAADDIPKQRDCVFTNNVQNWQVLDERHLIIRPPTGKNAYLLELMSPLFDAQFSEKLAFIDGDHNGMICGYGGDEIVVPSRGSSGFPSAITSMRLVNQEELKALGEKYHVQLVPKNQDKPHDKHVHD